MTEHDWLSCTDPRAAVEEVAGRVGDRKLRLFAAGVARLPHLWRYLTDPRSREAVEVAERFADGSATADERAEAWAGAHAVQEGGVAAQVIADIRRICDDATGKNDLRYDSPDCPQWMIHVVLESAQFLISDCKAFPPLWAVVAAAVKRTRPVGRLYDSLQAAGEFDIEQDFASDRERKRIFAANWQLEQAFEGAAEAWAGASRGLEKTIRAMAAAATAAADCCAAWGVTRSGVLPVKGCAKLFRCVVGNPYRPVPMLESWRTPTVVALASGVYADRAFDRLPILADALEEAGCDHPGVLAHCRDPGPHARGCWVVDGVLGKG